MSEFDAEAELKAFTEKFRERIENWMKKYTGENFEPIPVGVNPDGSVYWDKRKERDAETRLFLKNQEMEKLNEQS